MKADVQLKGTPNEGLFGATLGFFVGFAAVSLFGPTATRFKEVMDLEPALVGLLVAIPMLTGSILRIPFSAWVDTTGGRKPFLVLLLLSIVGLGGLFFVFRYLYPDNLSKDYYPLLLILGALSGCGIASFSVGISQVSYWFPKNRQGWALGAFAGFGNTAPGLIAFALPVVLASWGMTGAYMTWLAILVLGTALYAVTGRNAWYFQLRQQGYDPAQSREIARNSGQENFPAGTATDSLKISARAWKTWLLVALYFTTFGGFLALTSWFPTYWQEFHGLDIAMAGALTATFSLLASLIRVPGGHWTDKFGGERILTFSLIFLLAGAITMTVSYEFMPALIGEILIAIGMGVGNAAVFKLVPQEVPEAVGGAAGWVGGLGAFGGFAVPPMLGLFVAWQGTAGYAYGFSVYIGLSVMCLIMARILHVTGREVETAAHA